MTDFSGGSWRSLITGDTVSTIPDITIPDSGVLKYDFKDNTATDRWGSFDGTLNGPTYLSGGGPDGTGAFDFDGSNDYITVPEGATDAVESAGEASVYILVKLNDINRDHFLLSGNSSRDLYLYMDADGGGQGYRVASEGATSDTVEGASSGIYQSVVVTAGPNNGLSVYTDGSLTDSVNGSLDTSIGGLDIGRGTSSSRNLDGEIAEFRMYDKELTALEVSNLHSARSAIPDAALLHYPFGERSDSTLTESLVGANGTAVNGLVNTSGNWFNSYAEVGDGVDDYGELTDWSEIDFGQRLTGSWGLALTISDYTGSGNAVFLGQADTSTPGFQFHIGDENRQTANGNVELTMIDRTGSSNPQVIEGAAINDGGTYRIMVGGDGPTASDKVMFVNAVDETSIARNDGSQTGASNFTVPVTTHARNRSSGVDLETGCVIDNIIPLDSKPTTQDAQEDYDNQPWS